jgi:hypothetical protein
MTRSLFEKKKILNNLLFSVIIKNSRRQTDSDIRELIIRELILVTYNCFNKDDLLRELGHCILVHKYTEATS